jgi:hypothetical protein
MLSSKETVLTTLFVARSTFTSFGPPDITASILGEAGSSTHNASSSSNALHTNPSTRRRAVLRVPSVVGKWLKLCRPRPPQSSRVVVGPKREGYKQAAFGGDSHSSHLLSEKGRDFLEHESLGSKRQGHCQPRPATKENRSKLHLYGLRTTLMQPSSLSRKVL